MNDDTLFEQLAQQLAKINRRRKWLDAWLWLPRGMLAGLMMAALLATISRFRPLFLNIEIAWASIILGVLGILISAVILIARRNSLLEQARFADGRLLLLERTSTAVELQLGHIQTNHTLAQKQLSETMQALAQIDIKRKLPLRVQSIDMVLLAFVILLLLGAIILPNQQNDILIAERSISEEIELQIVELEELVDKIVNDPELGENESEQLLVPLEEALEELRQGVPSQEVAVAVLSETSGEFRELSAQNSNSLTDNVLDEAATSLVENQTSQEFGRSLQEGELSAASEALFRFSEQIQALSDDDLSNLASGLSETSANLENIDPELANNLEQAARAIQERDLEGSQQALEATASTLQQRAQEAALTSQASQIAKQLEDSRQQLAQAGQNGQQVQGPGESEGEGSQTSTSDQGEGQGSGPGRTSIDGQSQGIGGPGPGGGHVDQVFVPSVTDISDIEGIDIELPAECLSASAECGSLLGETPTQFLDEESLVPYSQVFGDYRDTAYQSLDSEYIPLNMKNYIRDYFSSLEP
jgi:hypothetical protein